MSHSIQYVLPYIMYGTVPDCRRMFGPMGDDMEFRHLAKFFTQKPDICRGPSAADIETGDIMDDFHIYLGL